MRRLSIIVFLFSAVIMLCPSSTCAQDFIRGDLNADGVVNQDDLCLLACLAFGTGCDNEMVNCADVLSSYGLPAPTVPDCAGQCLAAGGICELAGNMNPSTDCSIDVTDVAYLVNYLKGTGAAPPAPFPNCGPATHCSGTLSCGLPCCGTADMDGDGWSCAAGDCNDGVNTIYPGAPDPCDGIDQDCNGVDGVNPDGDGDLYGSDCDCDDGDININPGATEVPDDGIDQDCSGSDAVTCFEDLDGDGYGTPVTVVNPSGNCTDPGYSGLDTDCDDGDAGAYPGATEIPDDGIDQDCSGSDAVTCFEDLDGDGYGSSVMVENPAGNCSDPGYSAVDTDCDDGDAGVYPGATEIPDDGIDQDCSGSDAITCFEDLDGDGYGSSVMVEDPAGNCSDPGYSAVDTDCDDGDAGVYSGATEIPDDGIDQDCNGSDAVTCFEDLDEDGYGSTVTVLNPDGNCTDPGYSSIDTDCDDDDATTYPGSTAEIADGSTDPADCDGADNDCNGTIDDATPDTDGDLVADLCDNCPSDPNDQQRDHDHDGVGSRCDNCPGVPNPGQREFPGEAFTQDGVGDRCDNCPTIFNPGQRDTDADGIGNRCEFMFPFMATGASPVYVVVITPEGDSIGPDFNTMGWYASYEDSVDYTEDGDPDDRAVIQFALNGDYLIRVYARPEALPGDTYTLMSVLGNGTEVTLVQDQPVPEQGQADVYLHSFYCACPCHADPQCDGLTNVLDVVRAVDVGFRGTPSEQEPDCSKEQTDVSCDGYTNVIDVVKFVNVAFRGGDPEEEFCLPCHE